MLHPHYRDASRSGCAADCPQCEFYGVVEAERHAFGVGQLKLPVAEARADFGEAVAAVAGFGLLPLLGQAVKVGLRETVQLS